MPNKQETQGWCEGVCGLYDHHLIDGLCPQCRKRFAEFVGEHACDDDYAPRLTADDEQAWREVMNVEIAA